MQQDAPAAVTRSSLLALAAHRTPRFYGVILSRTLSGNVRQWIGSALGGEPDERVRRQEFDERGPIPAGELRRRLDETMEAARRTIDALDPATLLERRRVQGFEETKLAILVHVLEHFSYHAGQIAQRTKELGDLDLGFYAGQDLDRRG